MSTQATDFPSSGDPKVDAALQRLRAQNDKRFNDLEDAMLIHANLEASAARRIKEHAEFIVRHDQFIDEHAESMRQFDIKMREIEDKLNLLLDREMRREGGPETN